MSVGGSAWTGKMGSRDGYCWNSKGIFILYGHSSSINTVIMHKVPRKTRTHLSPPQTNLRI